MQPVKTRQNYTYPVANGDQANSWVAIRIDALCVVNHMAKFLDSIDSRVVSVTRDPSIPSSEYQQQSSTADRS